MDKENVMTAKAAARAYGVGVRTIYRWISKGYLFAMRPGGPRGYYHIPEDEGPIGKRKQEDLRELRGGR